MTNSYVSLDVFKGEGVMNIVGDGGTGGCCRCWRA